ncbi:MAG: flippase [Actinomycetota bacterium]
MANYIKQTEIKASNLPRIFKNTVSLLGNKILTGLINLFFISYLARCLSREGFGMYTTIVTFIGFANIFADFGISTVIIREIAQDKTKANELFNNSIFLSLVFSLTAWLGVAAVAVFLNYPKPLILLIVLAGSSIIFNSIISRLTAVLSAFEKMEIFSFVGAVLSFLFALLGIFLLRSGFGLSGIVALMILGSLITAIILFYVVQKGFVELKFSYDSKIVYSLLNQAFPIFILISISILLGKMDIVMLSKMKPMQDVGIYGAAVQLNESLGIVTGCLLGAMLPFLSAQWKKSLETTYPIYRKSMKVMMFFSCFLTVSLFMLSKQIMPFIFGKEFEPSSLAFRILVWDFLFSNIAGPIGTILIVQKKKLKIIIVYSVILTVFNFALNLILIPRYSYIGASIATVVCTFLLLLMKIRLVSDLFKNCPSLIKLASKPVFAAFLTGIMIFFMRSLFFPIPLFIGFILYSLLLIIMGEFKIKSIIDNIGFLKVRI